MYSRELEAQVHAALQESPAVALLGPRQVGMTTLALSVTQTLAPARGSVYLDPLRPLQAAACTYRIAFIAAGAARRCGLRRPDAPGVFWDRP